MEDEVPFLGSTNDSDDESSKEIERPLTQFDQYTSDRDKEQIRFVAASIFPALTSTDSQDPPSKILEQLQITYDDAEGLAIFRKVLECSCLDNLDKELAAVYRHCPPKVSEEHETLVKDLFFRKKLLEKCSVLKNNKKLFQRFRDRFTSEDVGMSIDDIKSYEILLLKLGLKPDMLNEVLPQLDEVIRQTSNTEYEDEPDGLQQRYTGPRANSPVGNPQRDGSEPTRNEGARPSRYRCKLVCITGSTLVFFMLTIPLATFSVWTGILSSETYNNTMILVRNTTTLLTSEPLNSQYYRTVNLSLDFQSVTSHSVLLCYFDCTHEQTHTQTVHLTLSYTSTPDYLELSPRRLVRLQEPTTDQPMYNNLYLLGGSTLVFNASKAESPFELHFVTSSDTMFLNCYNFLHQKSNSSYRHFVLNNSNGFTAKFSVPPEMHGTYYCAVIVGIAPNVSINYSIDARINVYNIDYYRANPERATCVYPIPGSATDRATYTFSINTTVQEQRTCVLLAKFDSEATFVEVEIHAFTTLTNLIFGGFVAAGCLFCVCFLCCFIVCFWLSCCKSSFKNQS